MTSSDIRLPRASGSVDPGTARVLHYTGSTAGPSRSLRHGSDLREKLQPNPRTRICRSRSRLPAREAWHHKFRVETRSAASARSRHATRRASPTSRAHFSHAAKLPLAPWLDFLCATRGCTGPYRDCNTHRFRRMQPCTSRIQSAAFRLGTSSIFSSQESNHGAAECNSRMRRNS
jgi:hypothetical protein